MRFGGVRLKTKKVPMRMCVGCREMKPKRELVRLVFNEEALMVDGKGKLPGRGAYLCPKHECLDKALKTKAIQRALEKPIDDEIVSNLRREFDRREL